MAGIAQSPPPILIDRADIHKSCKALENIVNIFAEYCHALNAVVSQQKKLSKALKEAAGLRSLNEITVNAMSCSAGIFETLSEVDGKFTKFADKECENISSEIRKWFKKLAKEEKLHDERIANMNAKIKQAGQAYEKKAKKNTRDAVEEHTRYVTLLNSLGPDMSQDKYNHSLLVTQKQQIAVYSVAACLSRMADAEWLRTCEGVRKFGSAIGQLAEWRTLCEGGWMGALPQDLPGDDARDSLSIPEQRTGAFTPRDDDERRSRQESLDRVAQEMAALNTGKSTPALATPAQQSPVLQSNAPLPALGPPATDTLLNSSSSGLNELVSPQPTGDDRGGTIRSLSAFPQPPTHFPIPNLRSPSNNSSESSTKPTTVSPVPQSLEPLQEDSAPPAPDEERTADATPRAFKNIGREDSDPPRVASPSPIPSPQIASKSFNSANFTSSSDSDHARSSPIQSFATGSPIKAAYSRSGEFAQGDYLDDSEFGVQRRPHGQNAHSRTFDSSPYKAVDMAESPSTRPSIVASMKDRYSGRTSGPASPKPRDLPRLPTSVSALANRYEPIDPQAAMAAAAARASSPPASDRYGPLSPQNTANTADTVSSVVDRYRMPDPQPASPSSRSTSGTNATQPSLSTPPPHPDQDLDDGARRRRRIEDLKELERKEHELELRERELEIERRAQQLERERARIYSARTNMGDDGGSETPNITGVSSVTGAVPRPRTMSVSATPQQRSPVSGGGARPESQYSNYSNYSHQHGQQQPSDSYPFPYSAKPQAYQGDSPKNARRMRRSSTGNPGTEHAPFCGCQTCSVERYKQSAIANGQANANPTSPIAKPIALRAEKPKSWMRRLSMPVVAPFSSDGKRGASSGEPRQVGAGIMGGSRNSLALPPPDEDPRTSMRKSWERESSGAVSNRSTTSFASGGR